MDTIRLRSIDSSLYNEFEAIYKISFPVFEQRTSEQQIMAFSSPLYHLDCFTEEDGFIGFIAWWNFDYGVYIEHFAIHPRLRGKGYEGNILQQFIVNSRKPVILEIDPVVDEISAARLRFYKTYGFVENPYKHIHPAYRNEYAPHSLVVLSTQAILSPEQYQQFNKDLQEQVMNME
ncbi:MAG: GNAT family N-acetyltransferase [Tannerellaceae bacterium]|nr:GNAT family N-acetyltransferase [Tannerellaceae bacterium]